MNPSTFIIAEAGVNHNGSLPMALELIDTAHQAGADAVKFQTFEATSVISRHALKAEYQISATGEHESQLDMVKKLQFDHEVHRQLVNHCSRRGIRFLSTPFDEPSIDLLQTLDVPIFKIPSGEITNALLLLKIARTGKPTILSTGMTELGDIETALGVVAFGYLQHAQLRSAEPSRAEFENAYRSTAGQELLAKKVTLLHCTTEYPAPFSEVNLKVLDTLRAAFGLPVGYSDHTPGIAVPIAAVARGAAVIEKHFTLSRELPGPDHRASLEPSELKAMIRAIRETELALGGAMKLVTSSEAKNRPVARKSLVASRRIARGERFTTQNLTAKRPGTGVSPMRFWDFLGRTARRDYESDDLIDDEN